MKGNALQTDNLSYRRYHGSFFAWSIGGYIMIARPYSGIVPTTLRPGFLSNIRRKAKSYQAARIIEKATSAFVHSLMSDLNPDR